MPGKHGPSKRFVSFSITRELWYKITQYAESQGMDRNAFAINLFENEMERLHVKLTPENEKKIAAETEAVRRTRSRSWALKDPNRRMKTMFVMKAEAKARKEAAVKGKTEDAKAKKPKAKAKAKK